MLLPVMCADPDINNARMCILSKRPREFQDVLIRIHEKKKLLDKDIDRLKSCIETRIKDKALKEEFHAKLEWVLSGSYQVSTRLCMNMFCILAVQYSLFSTNPTPEIRFQ